MFQFFILSLFVLICAPTFAISGIQNDAFKIVDKGTKVLRFVDMLPQNEEVFRSIVKQFPAAKRELD